MIRASLIADYVREAGIRGVVCFGCGNGAAALRDAGLYVVDVGPRGSITPTRWWQPEEIRRAWPDLFDATSGHLPPPLMDRLAVALREFIGELPEPAYAVPTGSGETVVALCMAYPGTRFIARYGDTRETRYDPDAPLNTLVERLCEVQRPTDSASMIT